MNPHGGLDLKGPNVQYGLLRRLALGGDPQVMLPAALKEAATAAGVELAIEADGIYLAVPAA